MENKITRKQMFNYIVGHFSKIYDLREHATWEIRSIMFDGNKDNLLGVYTGILLDIIEYITDDSFDGFLEEGGRFGTIVKIDNRKINGDTLLKKNELEKKKEFIEKELEFINKQLEKI